MAYLYGDSTESGLELNYIELLRDFLDFGAQVLMSEHRIAGLVTSGEEQRRGAERELERLKELSHVVEQALDRALGADPQSPTDRCAASIRAAAFDTIKRGAESVKASVAESERQVTAKTQRERAGNVKLLERLLRDHELPDQTSHIHLALDEHAGCYETTLRGRSPVGLEWSFRCDIPAAGRFAGPVRIGQYDEHLEVRLPEKSGLVRKSTKLRAHKLAGLYLVALEHATDQTTLVLRNQPQQGEAGFDITVSPTSPAVRLVRVQKDGETSPTLEPRDEDAERIAAVAREIVGDSSALAEHRSTLQKVSFDGKPLESHPDPALLVRRLVERLAPVIQQIARRSLAPGELVLKRVLAGDRREEIFASVPDLTGKLTPVPAELRQVFAPLGLGIDDLGDDEATTEMVVPPREVRGNPSTSRSGSIEGGPVERGSAGRIAPPPPMDDSMDDEETAVAAKPEAPAPQNGHASRAAATLDALEPPPGKAPAGAAAAPVVPTPRPPVPPKSPAAKPASAAAKSASAAAKPAAEPARTNGTAPSGSDAADLETSRDEPLPDSIDVALAELESESAEDEPSKG